MSWVAICYIIWLYNFLYHIIAKIYILLFTYIRIDCFRVTSFKLTRVKFNSWATWWTIYHHFIKATCVDCFRIVNFLSTIWPFYCYCPSRSSWCCLINFIFNCCRLLWVNTINIDALAPYSRYIISTYNTSLSSYCSQYSYKISNFFNLKISITWKSLKSFTPHNYIWFCRSHT